MRADPASGLRPIVIGAGIVGMVVGGGHVVAWMTGLMAHVAMSTIIMKANAGLGLLVAGLALILLSPSQPSERRRRVARGLAAFACLIGLATLSEHVAGWDLHIDQILARERAGAAATTSPNRMGPPAATSLLLLGCALLTLARGAGTRRRGALHEPFALVVVWLGLLSVIGYLYRASGLYQVARLTAIAWPTALSLLALAVGVLCARPDEGGVMGRVTARDTGGTIIRALLGPIVLLPLVFGWARLEGERHGWFDAPMGTGLMMLLFIVTFSSMLLFAGRRVSLASAAVGTREEALRSSEEKFSKAFHVNTAAMAIARLRDGLYIDVNDRFVEVTGYPREQAVGRSALDLKIWRDPRDRDAFLRALTRHGVVRNLEYRFVRRNGEPYTVVVSSQVSEIEGEPVLISSFADVTEAKTAEEALRESERRYRSLAEELGVANDMLAEADRRKDEFIAILSHELRNPLAPIRYALPLLRAQKLDDGGDRALAVIDRQVDHLARLVDDLLDVSRITGGKIELRREYVTLSAVLTAAAEAASPAIVAARHKLNIVAPDEPIWLHADPARVSQIVTNLLNNSAKYTPRGGEILLQAGREDGEVVIRVRDNGIGIPADALSTVFDMFRQVDRPDKSQGGLGIGLALAKWLVDMHGGTIEARSDGVDCGAEFVVRLPIAADGVAEAQEQAAMPAAARPLRVLIVDDNADLVEMVAMVVESAGHEARKALDGRSAISAALSYRPHVVLLDLGLPMMSGLEVAKELRRHQEMAGVRLVAVTGWGQAEDRRQTREAGFDHHLTKPTEPQALQQLLADIAAEVRERPPGD